MAGVGAGEHDVRRVGGRGDEHEAERDEHRRQQRQARPRHAQRRGALQQLGAHRVAPAANPRFERLERDRRLGLCRRDVVPQPDGHLDAALAWVERVLTEQRPIHRDRNPRVAWHLVHAGELGRHDADDDQRNPVDVKLATDHCGVASEQTRPGLIRQHHHRFAVWRVRIGIHQAAAEGNAGPEAVEVVAGHEADRHLSAARRDGPPRLGDRAGEQIRSAAEVFVVAPAERRAAGFLSAPSDQMQAVGILHGERAQHVGIEDREDDEHEPHAGGKCEHGADDEGAAVCQAAPGVAEIVRELLEQHEPARLVIALACAGDAAEVAQRRGARLLGGQTLCDQPLGLVREVRVDLGGEVLIRSAPLAHCTRPLQGRVSGRPLRYRV